ncbi:two pore domain potassium channel family protein [Viridibacillus sp. YIM B01967]|uniref:Two pore domain potassium channel family protein n=1 Tax=Viridibacillus soli TaxID=2798301 RepID=A0ABS1HBN2_9BACL|nr:potassium channel family protein [Viridibacillus soli]MBK3496854.1 two pore domain potassium channel family protein [Viridibacillus soli]
MISFILTSKRLLQAFIRAFRQPMFISLFTTLFFIILSGTMFYTSVEGWSILDAIYFCVVSLIPSGVDTALSPDTNLGKVFTMFYLAVGVGVMFLALLILGKTMIKSTDDQEKEKQNDK